MPSPRKDSPASSRMTSPTPSVAATSRGPSVFGSRCRKIMRRRCAQRLRRADVALLSKPQHLRPHDAAGAEPSRGAEQQDERPHRYPLRHGQHEEENEEPGDRECAVHQAHEDSVHQPPQYPETSPTIAPSVIDSPTAITATASETRPPVATRASTSRLSWSVPKGCAHWERGWRPRADRAGPADPGEMEGEKTASGDHEQQQAPARPRGVCQARRQGIEQHRHESRTLGSSKA